MSTPTPYFTNGTARLSRHGDVQFDDSTAAPAAVADTYTVILADPSKRPALASATGAEVISGLPALGDAHPIWGDLTLADYRIKEHAPGEKIVEVVCEYNAAEEEETGGSGSQKIGRLIALDYPAYTQSGDLVTDQVSGAEVLNSAGDVFDNVPQFEAIYTGVHFTRRLTSFPSDVLALAGTVNSVAVTAYGVSFGKRQGRLRVGVRRLFDGSSRPWELDVTIEPRHTFVESGAAFRPDSTMAEYEAVPGRGYDVGWDVPLLDCGFQYLDGLGNKVRFVSVAENGEESAPQLPQLLKGDGGSNQFGSYPKSILVVQTAAGNPWTDLKLKTNAPA